LYIKHDILKPKNKIGVFDSGLGGLTILRSFVDSLPEYDYVYLGDNARAPYGNRSFDTVYEYTLQAVKWLFSQECSLIILACNTASAKALRNIQQLDLEHIHPTGRVLGVIRPTTQVIGSMSESRHLGIFATKGTVVSESYILELKKFATDLTVHQLACPMFVPLIENDEHLSKGADYFISKYCDELMSMHPKIDTLLLACTHYPLIAPKIIDYLPSSMKVVDQRNIVTKSLKEYLNKHTQLSDGLSRNNSVEFYTTDDTKDFDTKATYFFNKVIKSKHIESRFLVNQTYR
jgi:glutamate racemase